MATRAGTAKAGAAEAARAAVEVVGKTEAVAARGATSAGAAGSRRVVAVGGGVDAAVAGAGDP